MNENESIDQSFSKRFIKTPEGKYKHRGQQGVNLLVSMDKFFHTRIKNIWVLSTCCHITYTEQNQCNRNMLALFLSKFDSNRTLQHKQP